MEHRTATTPSAIKAADHDSINSSASPAATSSEPVPLTDPLLKTTHPRVFFFVLVALLILNQSFSAVYTVLSKRAYNTGLSPVILCFYRDATVAAILCICTRVIDGPLAVDWKHVPRLFFCGFTGVFSSQFFYTYGIKLTSSNNGAIMQLLTPVLTTGLSIALGLERLDITRCHGVTRLLGLASALGGAAFMLAGGFSASPTQTASDLLIGNILFIVNTSAVAMFLIAQKPLLQMCVAFGKRDSFPVISRGRGAQLCLCDSL